MDSATSDGQRVVVVALTGASGAIYGIRALQMLSTVGDVETHLVMSKGGALTVGHETDMSPADVRSLADRIHPAGNVGASLASGSFRTTGMLVAPCSMRTLGAIANSLADNLVVRAADVMLKERRPLVLMVRESPLHAGHLRLMRLAAEAGAIIAPPMPAFYHRPKSIDDLVDHTVARALELILPEVGFAQPWSGLA